MSDLGGYVPRMSAAGAERIRAWHERAYESAAAGIGTGLVMAVFDRTFVVPPQVFPPSGTLLAEAVIDDVRPGDRVLDMGTGCGVMAILAASEATQVTAIDINPHAVDAARYNAILNGVQDRIDVHEGDVFEGVDGRFDLIVIDPPFRWFAARDALEIAMTDEGYGALTRFVAPAPDHLTDGGRILLHFGTSADVAYLDELIERHGFDRERIANRKVISSDWEVEYFVLRLTR